MFVGEAPGAAEDKSGRPFVGASGKFLEAMLRDIGLEREDVFIANVNRCRPPGNRDPYQREIEACNPWLRAQLRIIQPKVICPLGRFALEVPWSMRSCRSAKCTGSPSKKPASSSSRSSTPPPRCTGRICATRSSPICSSCATLLQERGLWEILHLDSKSRSHKVK